MAILFLDTDCELWHTKAAELGFEVIKMPYTLDGVEYFYDLGENTDFAGFYKRMREGSVPVTSALNEEIYTEVFEPFFERGEEMLYMAFSSKMSCTFESYETAVKKLSEKYPAAKITRFDTKNICWGAGLPIYLAGKYFREGHSVSETVEFLEDVCSRVVVRFVVDDMVYLKRGGRISAAKAAFGTMMRIKPVIGVNEQGGLDVCAKLNGGSKRAVGYLVDEVAERCSVDKSAPVIVVNADCEATASEMSAKLKSRLPDVEVWEYPVGPVIGAHCGPGTIGVIFMKEKK